MRWVVSLSQRITSRANRRYFLIFVFKFRAAALIHGRRLPSYLTGARQLGSVKLGFVQVSRWLPDLAGQEAER